MNANVIATFIMDSEINHRSYMQFYFVGLASLIRSCSPMFLSYDNSAYLV